MIHPLMIKPTNMATLSTTDKQVLLTALTNANATDPKFSVGDVVWVIPNKVPYQTTVVRSFFSIEKAAWCYYLALNMIDVLYPETEVFYNWEDLKKYLTS